MIKSRLSILLGEKRWTQADLSRITRIRPNTICELYNDCLERVSLVHLSLICEALECELGELLVYVPDPQSRIEHYKAGRKKSK